MRLGKAAFWCWLVGFYLAFVPLYALGLMGMTRRLQHIDNPGWRPLLAVADLGAFVIFLRILCMIAQFAVSIRTRETRRDLTGDPWNGRTLEWATSSPPPAFNFAVMPEVETVDAFWEMKRTGKAKGLSDGIAFMSSVDHDRVPGVESQEAGPGYRTYTIGLGLALLATVMSFVVAQTDLLWPPGIAVGLLVLAIAQIGVHLVFFLHMGSGPDNTNNILALAFGTLVVFLVIGGSIWIISSLDANMMMTTPGDIPR